MKIAVNTFPLSSGHSARGMGVYTRNLIKNLNSVDSFLFSENKDKLKKYGLLHYPYFDLFFRTLPVKKIAKTIVTIPDTIALLYPKLYPPGIKGKVNYLLQRLALRNVDAIITISETSKKDIVRLLDIAPEKIFVTKLAGNFEVRKASTMELVDIRNKYKLPSEFVLYIGDVNWNKNVVRLIKAVKKINKTLVIVGKNAVNTDYDKTHIENAPLKEIQEKYGEDRQILRLGFVEDEDLGVIWQLASVYCMPSLYEGFGLSIVEAMDAGVPVVCSRTQALVEVAGEGASYFDPYSVEDIAAKLKEIITNKHLRKSLILKGKRKAKEYSWKKTARETMEVYKHVLQSP